MRGALVAVHFVRPKPMQPQIIRADLCSCLRIKIREIRRYRRNHDFRVSGGLTNVSVFALQTIALAALGGASVRAKWWDGGSSVLICQFVFDGVMSKFSVGLHTHLL